MKNIILLFCVLFVFSCKEEKNVVEATKVEKDTVAVQVNKNREYSNPILIYGSSFGNYFQTLYRLGNFDDMLLFTHSTSIEKHGKEAILDHYKNMKFNYNIKLFSQIKINDSTFVLNYNSTVIATKSLVRMTVGIENDSVKVILPENLNEFP